MTSIQLALFGLTLAAILIGNGCPVIQQTAVPPDFSLRYEWKEASVPPPDHYEYVIVVGPGTEGRIDFWPDYPSEGTPIWSESFEIDEQAFQEIYEVTSRGIAETGEEAGQPMVVGGVIEILEVTARNESTIVTLLDETGHQLRRSVRALVPEGIWTELMGRRERYVRAAEGG